MSEEKKANWCAYKYDIGGYPSRETLENELRLYTRPDDGVLGKFLLIDKSDPKGCAIGVHLMAKLESDMTLAAEDGCNPCDSLSSTNPEYHLQPGTLAAVHPATECVEWACGRKNS